MPRVSPPVFVVVTAGDAVRSPKSFKPHLPPKTQTPKP